MADESDGGKVTNLPHTAEQLNPFDPAALRLDQEFLDGEVSKVVTEVGFERSNRHEFIRTHPRHRFGPMGILKIKLLIGGTFVVVPQLYKQLSSVLREELGIRPAFLYYYITSQGRLGLWPAYVPHPLKPSGWTSTAITCLEKAKERWVKIVPLANGYEGVDPVRSMDEPTWPDLTEAQILELGLKDVLAGDMDHPAMKLAIGASS
jgi:hypothetical protein